MAQIESINPLNGEVVGTVEVTAVSDLEGVLLRSQKAQKAWAKKSVKERADILRPAGALLQEKAREIGEIMTREMGKPVKSATGEVAGIGKRLDGELDEIVKALSPEKKEGGEIDFIPYGVSLAITPWNFPVLMPHWQILPSLIAGNSVIFKPSEETPLCAQAYADVLNQFLPEDVLITVHGNAEQGKALVEADPVKLITFTGSRAAGLHILQSASRSLKRVILELGGKDPLVVLKGADVAKAATFAANNGFRNSGQVCVSTERVYVHNDLLEEFNSELKKNLDQFKVGDGLEEETDFGPMVNERQKNIVTAQIEEAKKAGANVLLGGKSEGNFVYPTVLTNVDHGMAIMRDETFGPVVGVMGFDENDKAIELANDTPYGLGAVIFGEDQEAAQLARQLESGMVGINKGVSGVPGTPWVGAKESGFGFHSSEMGHRQFAQVRVLSQS